MKFSLHQAFVQASSSPGIPSLFSLTWAITIPPSLRSFPRLGWQPLLWAPAAPKAYPPEHLPNCTVSFMWWRITDHYSGLSHLLASGSPNKYSCEKFTHQSSTPIFPTCPEPLFDSWVELPWFCQRWHGQGGQPILGKTFVDGAILQASTDQPTNNNNNTTIAGILIANTALTLYYV